jgi:hypothetical protein
VGQFRFFFFSLLKFHDQAEEEGDVAAVVHSTLLVDAAGESI